ncbi:MAG: aminoglycoside phosphotransferase family protein [Nocardioides sp.]
MIEVPQGLRDSPRFWDDAAGRAWLDRVPALVAKVCADWELRPEGTARHGSHALVLMVTSDRGPAALRLTPPGPRAEDDLRALSFWPGDPVVSVLRASADGSVLLLERLDQGASLSAQPPEVVAEVLGGLVARMVVPGPPGDVRSTADEAADLLEHGRRRWEHSGRVVAADALDTALVLAAELALEAPDLAVNGDVHADQVLRDAGGEWRVVDPLLMRGDPAYDLARAVWTTVDRLADARSVVEFSDRLVAATGLDRSRAEAWLRVRTVGYWLWCLEAGLTEDPVRCARLAAAWSPGV